MHTILDAISNYAAESNTKPALKIKDALGWTAKTYAELDADIEGWRGFFAKMDLQPGSVAFIILSHRADMYALFLGVMKAGLIPSFLPFPTPKQDKTLYWNGHIELLNRVRPGCIISYGTNVTLLQSITASWNCAVLDIDQLTYDDLADATALPEIPADAVTILQHSSGTTGLKKGVPLTTHQLFYQLNSYRSAVNVGPSSRIISWLPLYHDMGLISCFLLPLWSGAEILSLDAFEWLRRPDQLLTLIKEFQATHCWLPNFAFNHLVRTRDKKQQYDLSSLKLLASCSEPAKPATLERFTETFAGHGLSPLAPQVCYAMAEAVFAVTQTDLQKAPRIICLDRAQLEQHGVVREVDLKHPAASRYLSCGSTVENVDIRIAAKNGQDIGEVCITGPFVFDGYFQAEERQAKALSDGWFFTGDIGFILDGELYICGRTKELMIVHGKNYYVHDIEEAVFSVDEVKPGRAVAFGVFDAATGSEQAVLLAETDAAADDWPAIREVIRRRVFDSLDLSLSAIELLPIGQILKTTSGKVDRYQNRIRFETGRLSQQASSSGTA